MNTPNTAASAGMIPRGARWVIAEVRYESKPVRVCVDSVAIRRVDPGTISLPIEQTIFQKRQENRPVDLADVLGFMFLLRSPGRPGFHRALLKESALAHPAFSPDVYCTYCQLQNFRLDLLAMSDLRLGNGNRVAQGIVTACIINTNEARPVSA